MISRRRTSAAPSSPMRKRAVDAKPVGVHVHDRRPRGAYIEVHARAVLPAAVAMAHSDVRLQWAGGIAARERAREREAARSLRRNGDAPRSTEVEVGPAGVRAPGGRPAKNTREKVSVSPPSLQKVTLPECDAPGWTSGAASRNGGRRRRGGRAPHQRRQRAGKKECHHGGGETGG